jgi:hypothetical protein
MGPVFTPHQLDGLLAWYRADRGITQTNCARFVSVGSNFLSTSNASWLDGLSRLTIAVDVRLNDVTVRQAWVSRWGEGNAQFILGCQGEDNPGAIIFIVADGLSDPGGNFVSTKNNLVSTNDNVLQPGLPADRRGVRFGRRNNLCERGGFLYTPGQPEGHNSRFAYLRVGSGPHHWDGPVVVVYPGRLNVLTQKMTFIPGWQLCQCAGVAHPAVIGAATAEGTGTRGWAPYDNDFFDGQWADIAVCGADTTSQREAEETFQRNWFTET